MTYLYSSYVFLLLILSLFSYCFVNPNFPLNPPNIFYELIRHHNVFTTIIYISIVIGLFLSFWCFLKKIRQKKIGIQEVKKLIFVTVGILFFSWPALSYDIFNYIATAKVFFFYKENPYLIMPIEFTGDSLLKFMHAANKIALYGPSWILLTGIPHFAGFGNLILTLFTFKAFIALFYLLTVLLIWRLSNRNLLSVVFFAFNPLVLIETLVSSHNDIAMMAFTLSAVLLVFHGKKLFGFLSLLISIGIKYATIVLLPLFLWPKKLSPETFFMIAYWLMFLAFLSAPLREEIYPWYVIWLITFAALLPKNRFIFWITSALSFATLLRYIPFIYSGTWEGLTPVVKKIVTIIPPAAVILTFFVKGKLWSKKFFHCWQF